MPKDHIENARKTHAYLVAARRRMSNVIAANVDLGLSSIKDAKIAKRFYKLQMAVEAARAALNDEYAAAAGDPPAT
ncbi:MAG TPA: hypothetical protein K8W01_01250 [Methylorubrum populi]|uniref:Uncharacterized protein n=1 Tax=Methylorubrum populi TaxID=223967 RepID=A0A921DZA8_9HYPH|nr:hypothetical protein [Methylorubrum populi]